MRELTAFNEKTIKSQELTIQDLKEEVKRMKGK